MYLLQPDVFAESENTSAETVMVETAINAITGQTTARRALHGQKPYTVDRGSMRNVLLRGLEDHIDWHKTAVNYEVNESNPSSPVTVHFTDGTSVTSTLLVGANGNHSQIRRPARAPSRDLRRSRYLSVRTDIAPAIQQIIFDSKLPISMFVERIHSPQREPSHPELSDDYMYWSMLIPSKMLVFTEELVSSTYQSKMPKELALMLTGEWHDSFRCLIALQDETFATKLRIVSSNLPPSEWGSSAFVTLVGNSIHVMSPAGGVGAATAVNDAVALSKVLTGLDGFSLPSIKAYEASMRITAKVAVERRFREGKLLYGQPEVENCRILSEM